MASIWCGVSRNTNRTILGIPASWILIEVVQGESSPVPAQLIGLVVSAAGIVAGSLLPQWTGQRR